MRRTNMRGAEMRGGMMVIEHMIKIGSMKIGGVENMPGIKNTTAETMEEI